MTNDPAQQTCNLFLSASPDIYSPKKHYSQNSSFYNIFYSFIFSQVSTDIISEMICDILDLIQTTI